MSDTSKPKSLPEHVPRSMAGAGMTYQRHMTEVLPLKPVAKTGWPPSALLQDDDRKLFQWFASRPDARLRVREAAALRTSLSELARGME